MISRARGLVQTRRGLAEQADPQSGPVWNITGLLETTCGFSTAGCVTDNPAQVFH